MWKAFWNNDELICVILFIGFNAGENLIFGNFTFSHSAQMTLFLSELNELSRFSAQFLQSVKHCHFYEL